MNKQVELIFTLSFFTMACRTTFPEFLNHDFIQIPSLVIFSIIAPVGFAINLWGYFALETKSTWQLLKPTGYLILFGLVFVGSQVSFYSSQSTLSNLDVIDRSLSANLLGDLGTAETEKQRAIIAKFIYSEFGAALPYAKQDGMVTIYKPDQTDIELYKKSAEIQSQGAYLKTFMKDMALESMAISIYLIFSFLILFFSCMFYLQSKANK
jgi:hypothetical protein